MSENAERNLVRAMNRLNRNIGMQNNMSQIIPMFPKFSGRPEDNFEFFMTQFENLASLAKLDEFQKVTFLKANLTDVALNFIARNDKLTKESSFEELARHLRGKFAPQQNFTELQEKFSAISQLPTQSLSDIADEIEISAYNLTKDLVQEDQNTKKFIDNMCLQKFLDAIRLDIRTEVKKHGPTSFKQALKIAKQVEAALKDEHRILNMSAHYSTQQTKQEDKIGEIQKQQENVNFIMQELITQINSIKSEKAEVNTPKDDRDTINCYICGKQGHWTANCWFHPMNQTPNTQGYREYNSDQNREKYTHFRNPPNNYRPQTNFNSAGQLQSPRYPMRFNNAKFDRQNWSRETIPTTFQTRGRTRTYQGN